MAKEVRLPRFGQTMEDGMIVGCEVSVGDEVKKGDVIFEIETDKATLEMESPAGGFVKHVFAEVGQTLNVGEAMLVLGESDEEVPQSFIDSLKSESASEAVKPTGVQVKGGGEKGAVVKTGEAVEFAEAGEVKLGQRIALGRLQRITAEKMQQSNNEIPCFYLTVKADVSELVEERERLNAAGEVKVSYHDFIIRAVAKGLEKFPIMTGRLAGDVIELAEVIGVGLAISVPGGVVAPIVKDVNKKDVAQIACETKELIERAQDMKLMPEDFEGGCITVSNLGALGVESFIPVVVPGQCSILGVGRISDEYVPAGEEMEVRKFMNMTLSVDHKIAIGAYGAQFLDCVRKLLEDMSAFE